MNPIILDMLCNAFVATVGGMAFGAIWYSKPLFGKHWAKLVGVDMDDPEACKGMGKIMLITAIALFVIAFTMTLIMLSTNTQDLLGGVKMGVFYGVGIGAMVLIPPFAWEKRPLALYLINAGYTIGVLIVLGMITAWLN